MSEHGSLIWHELVTPDQTSGAFFSQLFGWTCTEVDAGPFGIYTLFQKNGRDIAGMINPTPDTPRKGPYWHAYIAVEDIEECARQVPLLGGNVVVLPHNVPLAARQPPAVVHPLAAGKRFIRSVS